MTKHNHHNPKIPMAIVAFDTHKYYNQLVKGGFTPQQAETQTNAHKESLNFLIDQHFATKNDVENIRSELSDIHSELNEVHMKIDKVHMEIDKVHMKIDTVHTELKSEIASEISGLRTELKSEIAGVRTELKLEIAELRTEFKSEFATLRSDMDKLFLKTISSIGGLIAAAVLIIPKVIKLFS